MFVIGIQGSANVWTAGKVRTAGAAQTRVPAWRLGATKFVPEREIVGVGNASVTLKLRDVTLENSAKNAR